jgi:mercuric ion transport protein
MTVPRVELVYDRDCPNVEKCRLAICAALREIGASASWHEWDRNDEGTPSAYRTFGSPTVLVNGRDMLGSGEAECRESTVDGNSCRVYMDTDSGQLRGAPSVRSIVKAIADCDGVDRAECC